MEKVIISNPRHVLMPSRQELDDVNAGQDVGRWKSKDCFICRGNKQYVGFVRGSTTEFDTFECDCTEQLVLSRWFAARGVTRPAMQLRKADMTGASPAWVQAAQNFIDCHDENLSVGLGMLLHGRSGSGKTSLAWLIMKGLLYHGHDCFAFPAANLSEHLFRWRNDPERLERWQRRVMHAEMLFVDDLGREVGGNSEFLSSSVDRIINLRSAERKSTIVTTNLTVDELKFRYGPAMMEIVGSTGTFLQMSLDDSWRDTNLADRLKFEADNNIARPAVWG